MKRTKLLVSLMMCVFCLSFLVLGVWAAVVSVNFNLNAGLKYYPEGVYVELSGQVFRGATADSFTPLDYDERFNLNPITNFDNGTGEPSGNFPMESWEIGSIPFIPQERFVKIEVYVKNYSSILIGGTPEITVNEGEDISTITNITATEDILGISCIEQNQTATYSLILEVTGDTTIDCPLNVAFNFGELKPIYEYFNIENNQITGLTQYYLDNSPDILIIPAYSQSGEPLTISSLSNPTANTPPPVRLDHSIVLVEEGITEVGLTFNGSFNNVETLILPSTITSIPRYTFYGYIRITNFIIKATTPPTIGSPIFNSSNIPNIYVPDESVDSYKTATNWSSYASQIYPISQMP